MKIPIDRQAVKPVYLQIRDRLSRLIQSGTFKTGDRLPSIRSLTKNIQVNKLNVIEAYSIYNRTVELLVNDIEEFKK